MLTPDTSSAKNHQSHMITCLSVHIYSQLVRNRKSSLKIYRKKGMLKNGLKSLISSQNSSMGAIPLLLTRYAFQATTHALWRERNNMGGEDHIVHQQLLKIFDKNVCNRLCLLRKTWEKYIWRCIYYLIFHTSLSRKYLIQTHK